MNSNRRFKLIYEIYDELIGSIIPGMYFCTYFILCAYFLIIPGLQKYFMEKNIMPELSPFWFVVPFFAVSYVLGTLFNRGNMEETDLESVKYILKRSKTGFANTEYMRHLESDYIDNTLYPRIDGLRNRYFFFISLSYIRNGKHFWNIHKKPQYVIYDYAYKRIKSAYTVFAIFYPIINPLKLNVFCGLKTKCDDFRETLLFLENELNIKTNYPYSYLRQYLNSHNLSCLEPYVSWNERETPSKSYISNILIEFEHVYRINTSQIKKRAAHIRFMNSTYHSQKCLFRCAVAVSVFSFLLLLGRFALYYYLKYDPHPELTFGPSLGWDRILYLINKGYNYLNRIVVEDNIFRILCISIVYIGFYLTITKKYVLGNFHFQRIRELVYILQLKYNCENNIIQASHKKSTH